MKLWTIKQLKEAMQSDLASCHTETERSLVKAIGGQEIRKAAQDQAKIRKLTPSELMIAAEFGFRGQS